MNKKELEEMHMALAIVASGDNRSDIVQVIRTDCEDGDYLYVIEGSGQSLYQLFTNTPVEEINWKEAELEPYRPSLSDIAYLKWEIVDVPAFPRPK